MKKIIITSLIETFAEEYLKELNALNPTHNLEVFRDNCPNLSSEEKAYINNILTNFNKCVLCKPSEFNNMNSSFPLVNVDLKKGIQYDNKTMPLYKHIGTSMCYDDVQSKIYPKYAKKLGIRACVYCNVQYAVSAKKGLTNRGKAHRTTYTLDHYMAKSDYPYLSVSFFNLFPCCASCNQTKSTKLPIWCLYGEMPGVIINPYKFSLENASLTTYLLTKDIEAIKIEFNESGLTTPTANEYDEYFHIRKIYENFKEEVEELIWKSQIYNKSWHDAFMASLPYDRLNANDINRFIIGNYDKEDDIHRRPLAKLIQEIAKQLHFI